jgi:hypothetical protein
MSESFVQLVYASTRVPGLTDPEFIDAVALPAVRKNRTAGITGCLWLSRSLLLGALEGPVARIDPLYAAIAADPRHTAPHLLLRTTRPQREFHRYALRWIPEDRLVPFERLVAHVRDAASSISHSGASPTPSAGSLLGALLEWSGAADDQAHHQRP